MAAEADLELNVELKWHEKVDSELSENYWHCFTVCKKRFAIREVRSAFLHHALQ